MIGLLAGTLENVSRALEHLYFNDRHFGGNDITFLVEHLVCLQDFCRSHVCYYVISYTLWLNLYRKEPRGSNPVMHSKCFGICVNLKFTISVLVKEIIVMKLARICKLI